MRLSLSLVAWDASRGRRENTLLTLCINVTATVSCSSFLLAEVSLISRNSSTFSPRNRHIWCHCCRLMEVRHTFYSAMLTMQTAVIATANLSVYQSVCLSVTFRCFVRINKDMIKRFSVSGIFWRGKFYLDFIGDHPSKGVKVKRPLSLPKKWFNNQPELGNGTR